jgi:hypothetical protein
MLPLRDFVFPVLFVVLSALSYENRHVPATHAYIERLSGVVSLGYPLSNLHWILPYFQSSLVLDAEWWTFRIILCTLFLLFAISAKHFGSNTLYAIALAFLVGMFIGATDKHGAVWSDYCPERVNTRIFQADANKTYIELLSAVTPLLFCNESSRFPMAFCENILFRDLGKPHRDHFNEMDYCGTMAGFLMAERCVNTLLVDYYKKSVRPIACVEVARRNELKYLTRLLDDWEQCIKNPSGDWCMVQQQRYRDMLQEDYNGSKPRPEMFWMIEIERKNVGARVKYAANFSQSWQE